MKVGVIIIRNYKKNIYALISLMILFSIVPFSDALAHSPSSCNSGSEALGWKVHCSNNSNGHLGAASTAYKFTPAMTSKYKNIVSVGISRWHATGIVTYGESTTSNNYISQHKDPNTSTVAYVQSQTTTSNHKFRWLMSFNSSIMDRKDRTSSQNHRTATHELGHVIGLGDLKQGTNKNKIMYGYSSRTATTPQASDRNGAREGIK